MIILHTRLSSCAEPAMRRRRRHAIAWGPSLLMLICATACDPINLLAPANRPVEAASLSIAPGQVASLALGRLVSLQAHARDETGAALPYAQVVWTTADPEVARVKRTSGYTGIALIEAVGPGATTLTAKSGSVSASITIMVHPPGPVASVVIFSESVIAVGKTVQLRVLQRDSDGVALSVPVPTFVISDSALARVSRTGLVTGLAKGSATVTATSNGASAVQQLSILAPEHAFQWTAALGMMDLGTAPGFVSSRALAVSSSGHVAGTMFTVDDSLSRAFVRAPGANAAMRDLGGLPGGGKSEAFGVNNSGEVVGSATTATGVPHAVLWRQNGTIVDLGTPFGGESVALAINDSGQAVGRTGTGAEAQPFIWTETRGLQSIAGIKKGTAFAINKSGVVAGESQSRPFTWNAGSSTAVLPILTGDVSGRALAISDAGEIVGYSKNGCQPSSYFDDDDDCNESHPVMWTVAGVATDLRKLGLGTSVAAAGINSAHQIVGSNYGSNNSQRAIVWSMSTGLRELGALPDRLRSAATAINDAGVVVGSSFNP